ncbi:MAG: SBBP repeat-containing protein [Verrucomicrobiales bacterium]
MKALSIFFLTTLFFTAPDSMGQVIAFGGTGSDEAQGVTTDASGNIFATGYFSGTVDFDPSDGSDAADTMTAGAGGQAGFVASYAPDGTFRFVVPITGAGAARPFVVAADASGNVFVAGIFSGTVDFDGGAGTQNRTGDGDNDGFLASYTNTGGFRFAHVLGGTGFTGCFSVAAAGNGHVIVTGGFAESVDVNPGAGAQVFNSGGGFDGYVAGFDSAGNFLYGRQLADADVYNIAADASGNSYVCGYFSNAADFDAADGPDASDSLTSAGAQDAFLASYSPAGAFRWVIRLGGELSDFAYGVAVDPAGNSFVAGSGTEIDFDPGAGTLELLPTTGFYLASYTSSGALRFAIGEGGSGFGSATPFYCSYRGGNVYAGGSFNGTVDLAPDDPAQGGILSETESAGFVARYAAADGALGFARSFGAGSASVWSVAGAQSGGAVVAGGFTDTGDFDPGIGAVEKTSAGEEDGYLLNLDNSGNYPGGASGSLVVTNTNDSGAGSLREAIATANATPTPDTVTFAIPGTGPHVTSPTSPLPVISTPVTLDGFSQPGSSGGSFTAHAARRAFRRNFGGHEFDTLRSLKNAVGAVLL